MQLSDWLFYKNSGNSEESPPKYALKMKSCEAKKEYFLSKMGLNKLNVD